MTPPLLSSSCWGGGRHGLASWSTAATPMLHTKAAGQHRGRRLASGCASPPITCTGSVSPAAPDPAPRACRTPPCRPARAVACEQPGAELRSSQDHEHQVGASSANAGLLQRACSTRRQDPGLHAAVGERAGNGAAVSQRARSGPTQPGAATSNACSQHAVLAALTEAAVMV